MSIQQIFSKLREDATYDAEFAKSIAPAAQTTYIICLTMLKIVSKVAFAIWITTLILRVTEITIPVEATLW